MKKNTWKRFLSMILALCMLCSAMPVMAVESELGTQENPVTDFADLKTLLANAAGSKEDPAEIYVSGMLESTESLTTEAPLPCRIFSVIFLGFLPLEIYRLAALHIAG